MNGKILIVDDEPDILSIMETSLRMEGYSVRKSLNGRLALEMLRSEPADLLITDIRMPEMDGLELISHVKELDPEIEIIVLTGYTSFENAVEALRENRAFTLMSKPLDNIDTLFHSVRQALEKRELRKQNRELMEELKTHRDHLEELVDARSNQLRERNEELRQEIRERIRTEEELKKAKEEAESANRLKSEFLANISHEIRTPLNAVLGFSEILAPLLKEEEQIGFLRNIRSAAKNLLALMNGIIDLSRIGSGRMEIQNRPVRPAAIFEEITRIFSLELSEKNIAFHTDISDDIPEILITDESKIRQILFYVVGNAVKFTEKGYIRLSAFPSDVREDKGSYRMDLNIHVEDSGIGISVESGKIIFDNFRQADGRIVRKYGGIGTGLALSRRMLEMMNGEISLQSEVGKGSVFSIILHDIPAAGPVPDSLRQKMTAKEHEGKGNPFFGKNEINRPESACSGAELQRILDERMLPRWEEILETFGSDELEDFGNEIMALGNQYGCSFLSEWGHRLMQNYEIFDIDKLEEIFKSFDALVRKMKEQKTD